MASPTRWTWVWVNSRSWWGTGRPGVLQFMGLQRVGHNWATELKLNWTAEIICSTARVCHERYWLGHRLLYVVRICVLHLESGELLLPRGYVFWVGYRGENIMCLLLQRLHQPGESLCDGCWASQEKRNMSAVLMAPQVFFQPLSSHRAHTGFSKQWGHVNRETTGAVSRINDTLSIMKTIKLCSSSDFLNIKSNLIHLFLANNIITSFCYLMGK